MDPDPATIVEGWLRFQGLSMAQLKRDDRHALLAGARREVMVYLRSEGWTLRQIGEFIDRDHKAVWNGLNSDHVPWIRRSVQPSERRASGGDEVSELDVEELKRAGVRRLAALLWLLAWRTAMRNELAWMSLRASEARDG